MHNNEFYGKRMRAIYSPKIKLWSGDTDEGGRRLDYIEYISLFTFNQDRVFSRGEVVYFPHLDKEIQVEHVVIHAVEGYRVYLDYVAETIEDEETYRTKFEMEISRMPRKSWYKRIFS